MCVEKRAASRVVLYAPNKQFRVDDIAPQANLNLARISTRKLS